MIWATEEQFQGFVLMVIDWLKVNQVLPGMSLWLILQLSIWFFGVCIPLMIMTKNAIQGHSD